MRTRVSIPDDLLAEADALRRKLGVSRSHLVADALSEYIVRHRSRDITDRLNALYAGEDGCLPPEFRSAQARSVNLPGW